MNKNLIGLAVAATLSITAITASAEDMFRGAWYAVPGISYFHADSDADNSSRGKGAFIKLGKELSPSWDLQGGLGYGTSGSLKSTTLGLDALYMFSRDKFRPFLLAGGGIASNKLDFKGAGSSDRTTSPMLNLGLGWQYLFSDNFGLQGDLRHVWSRAEDKDAVPANNFNKETIGNTLANLGGVFRFGAPAPVMAEAAPEPAPIAAAPEPAPAPAPEPVKCTPQMDTITVGAEKLFGFDKANLREEGKAALNDAAAKIKANPEIKAVIVTGHTDRLGSDAYNQKLSNRRANIVKDYLASQGVDPSIIDAVGKGEAEPVVQCTGNKATKKLISCLQPNRRVEIRAEGQKESGCN